MIKKVAIALFLSSFSAAHAGRIAWTQWTSAKHGIQGHADGVISLWSGPVNIRYAGEVESQSILGPSNPSPWRPPSTWIGGTVENAPRSGNQIAFYGGPNSATDTIIFSKPVKNPIIAIFSLGTGGLKTMVEFRRKATLTFEAGGPSRQYHGGPVEVFEHRISGAEGNGAVQLNGTFTRIRFTTPVYEDWASFTIGIPE